MVIFLSKLQGVEPDIPEILCATAPSKLLAPFCGCNVDHFCSWNCPHKNGKLEASCSTITRVLEHLGPNMSLLWKKSCNFASHILLYALMNNSADFLAAFLVISHGASVQLPFFSPSRNSRAQCELTFLPILHGNLLKKVLKSTLKILTVLCVIYHLKQILNILLSLRLWEYRNVPVYKTLRGLHNIVVDVAKGIKRYAAAPFPSGPHLEPNHKLLTNIKHSSMEFL